MAKKRGRPTRAMKALLDRCPPAEHILERRQLFAFVQLPKDARLDGRNGEIDSEVCDGIGQLHALGLLDGHGIDGRDLRDAGRFFRDQYWRRYSETAPKTGKLERSDKSQSPFLGETSADRRFDRMDEVLSGYERYCVIDLVINTHWTDGLADWAQALIDEALRQRGTPRRGQRKFVTMCQRARLSGAIRGLCLIFDGGMEMRQAA